MASQRFDIDSSIKVFKGYLEGTEKSKHTIRNYLIDINAFVQFFDAMNPKKVSVSLIQHDDLLKYLEFLKSQGLKTNTRRRRIMTLRKWFRFLYSRGKMKLDLSDSIPAPGKLERAPKASSQADWMNKIAALPGDDPMDLRNRTLLRTLAETGCLTSELTRMKFDDFSQNQLEITGKRNRWVPISKDLFADIQSLKKAYPKADHCFLAYSKSRFAQIPMTTRSIELLFKAFEGALGGPFNSRSFRQAAILKWHQDGMQLDEIKRRLGLKSDYAFRVYAAHLKSRSEATSIS